MQIAIIIVNYRTPGMTIDCLASLVDQCAQQDARVWVVDNLSEDGSVQKIQDAIAQRGWGDWVRLLASAKNGGFAAGNNVALQTILALPERPPFVLLLNPDTVVRPGAIASLVEFVNAHPTVGLAGSRLEHHDGEPQQSAFRFPTAWSELEDGMRLGIASKMLARWRVPMEIAGEPHAADWVAGASLLIRTEIFSTIGLMNEAYFMYYEEVDFCRRAQQAGWSCWYVPASRVVHLVGQASGLATSRRPTKRMPRYWFDSRALYFNQHHGRLYRLLADLGWSLGHLTFSLRNLIQRKPTNDPPKLLADFISYSFFKKASS